MNSQEQLASLYGVPATHSEYRIDERVSWLECGVEQHQATYAEVLDLLEAFKAMLAEDTTQ